MTRRDDPEAQDCELCGESESELEPLGHFKRPGQPGEYTLAHGQCGEDEELELA